MFRFGDVWERSRDQEPWQRAEELTALWMQDLGFTDALPTQGSGDRGVDVVAESAVAQVKMHAKRVQSPDIQNLRGAAYGVEDALFFSFSGFSAGAIREADRVGVALFDVVHGVPTPANPTADILVERAEQFRAEEQRAREAEMQDQARRERVEQRAASKAAKSARRESQRALRRERRAARRLRGRTRRHRYAQQLSTGAAGTKRLAAALVSVSASVARSLRTRGSRPLRLGLFAVVVGVIGFAGLLIGMMVVAVLAAPFVSWDEELPDSVAVPGLIVGVVGATLAIVRTKSRVRRRIVGEVDVQLDAHGSPRDRAADNAEIA